MIFITDALAVEHALLRDVFKHLEDVVKNMERVEDVKAIARMVEGLLHQHGEAEEQLLYVTIDHALAEIGHLDTMSQEHGELDGRLAKARTAGNAKESRRHLLAAMAFSRRHFENEEQNVFPFIRQRLSENCLKTLGEAFRLHDSTAPRRYRTE